MSVGILDLENKIAYMLDSKELSRKVFAKAQNEVDAWSGQYIMLTYDNLISDVRKRGFKICHNKQDFIEEVDRRAYKRFASISRAN